MTKEQKKKKKIPMKDKVKPVLIWIVSFFIVFALVVIVLIGMYSLYIYLNPVEDDSRITKELHYEITFNNDTNEYILTIGPFEDEDNKPIPGAEIALDIAIENNIATTDETGMVFFYIQPHEIANVTGREITGEFQKDAYYDAEFKFSISNIPDSGEFEVLMGKQLN